MSNALKKVVRSRTIWGGITLASYVLFGQEAVNAVNNLGVAIDQGTVDAVIAAAGGVLVAVGRARAKPW